MPKRKKKKAKYISYGSIETIKKLLDGYRLPHGYELKKRKRLIHKKEYRLFR